jgi:hypothetical protein
MDSLPHDKQPSETSTCAASKSRFHIEKLEERIAPAKGGIPGKPFYHDPPGQHCDWGGHKIHGYCGI